MEEYRRAADTTPTNISAQYQLARMYIHLKYFDVCFIPGSLTDPQAAERELLKLKDASPDNAKPYFMLGRIYKAKGDRIKALQNFTAALSLDPKARYNIIISNGVD
jgi:tetratricopeptide (TPR) repeat protein